MITVTLCGNYQLSAGEGPNLMQPRLVGNGTYYFVDCIEFRTSSGR